MINQKSTPNVFLPVRLNSLFIRWHGLQLQLDNGRGVP
jgi:hypothetical protein